MHDLSIQARQALAPILELAVRQTLPSPEFLDQLPVGVYVCDQFGLLVHYNRRAVELWGREPLAGEYYCGSHKLLHLDGAPLARAECPMVDVLRTGVAVRGAEVVMERPDGTQLVALANISPLRDDGGTIIGAVNCFQDITDLKRTQEREREGRRRFHELLQALPAAIYTTDAAGKITFYNEAAVALSGRRPTLGSDEWCVTWRLYWPDGQPMRHDECPMAIALKEKRPVRGAEAIAERPDGTRVPFLPFPTPLFDADGELIGAVNMLVDISERKQAEEHQRMLIDELNHRVKNTLATVQSLAAQTIRGDSVPQEIRDTFEGRLMALSQVHDQLSRSQWTSADFRAIIDDIFEPYRYSVRVGLRGDPVKLGPAAALVLSMVLHELTTNAAKYGALSAPGGTLTVSWTVEAGRLRVVWQEAGGPPVRAPRRQGFGSRLIERGITQELKGAADMSFEPTGLRCTLNVPLTP